MCGDGVVGATNDTFTTNIGLGGSLFSEASHYTDSENELELAADVVLQYDLSIKYILYKQ